MTTDHHYETIRFALKQASETFGKIIPSQINVYPSPDDFRDVARDLTVLARALDSVIEAYGDYAQANNPSSNLDLSLFRGQVLTVLEGDALADLERVAADIEDEQRAA